MPKTGTERMAELIARRKAIGLRELRGVWLPLDKHAEAKRKIKAMRWKK